MFHDDMQFTWLVTPEMIVAEGKEADERYNERARKERKPLRKARRPREILKEYESILPGGFPYDIPDDLIAEYERNKAEMHDIQNRIREGATLRNPE